LNFQIDLSDSHYYSLVWFQGAKNILGSSVAMAAWFWLCFLLGLFHFVVDEKIEDRNFWNVMDKIVTKRVAKEYFEDQNCLLRQYQNRSYMDCFFIFQRNVKRLQLEAQLDMFRPNNKTIRLVNVRLEVCDILTMVDKNPLVNIYAKTWLQLKDKNFNCPFKSVCSTIDRPIQ